MPLCYIQLGLGRWRKVLVYLSDSVIEAQESRSTLVAVVWNNCIIDKIEVIVLQGAVQCMYEIVAV